MGGGGVGPLMANAILNFHFDFLHPSLIVTVSDIVVIIRCGRQNHCPAQHGHCHDHQVWSIQIALRPFLGQGEGQVLGCQRYTNNLGERRKSLFKVLRVP